MYDVRVSTTAVVQQRQRGGTCECRASRLAAPFSMISSNCSLNRYEMENVDRAPVPLFSHSNTIATTPASVPAARAKPAASPQTDHSEADYTPLPWSGYFDNLHDIAIPNTPDTFRLYTAGQHGQPLIAHTTAADGCLCDDDYVLWLYLTYS